METQQEILNVTSKNSTMQFLTNCKKKLANLGVSLEQQKIAINSDDTLAEKTFFAFLADLLDSLKKKPNKILEIMEETKENERLTKQKMLLLIDEHLKETKELSKEILAAKGINLESLNKNLQNGYLKEFASTLLSNKVNSLSQALSKSDNPNETLNNIINQSKTAFKVETNDIQQITANQSIDIMQSVKNPSQLATSIVKHTMKVK